VLLKRPLPRVAAYIVAGLRGSIASAVTHWPVRVAVQRRPPSVLLKMPYLVPA
jgi:hypothetical protein